jgi:hypothetical protein
MGLPPGTSRHFTHSGIVLSIKADEHLLLISRAQAE